MKLITRERVQDSLFHMSIPSLYREKWQELKRLIMKIWTSFIQLESLRTPCKTFQHNHLDTLSSCSIQNPHKIFILSCVFQSDAIEGVFQNRINSWICFLFKGKNVACTWRYLEISNYLAKSDFYGLKISIAVLDMCWRKIKIIK